MDEPKEQKEISQVSKQGFSGQLGLEKLLHLLCFTVLSKCSTVNSSIETVILQTALKEENMSVR